MPFVTITTKATTMFSDSIENIDIPERGYFYDTLNEETDPPIQDLLRNWYYADELIALECIRKNVSEPNTKLLVKAARKQFQNRKFDDLTPSMIEGVLERLVTNATHSQISRSNKGRRVWFAHSS